MFCLTRQRESLVESSLVLLKSMNNVGAVPTFLRMVTCLTLKRRIKNCRSEVPVRVLLFEWGGGVWAWVDFIAALKVGMDEQAFKGRFAPCSRSRPRLTEVLMCHRTAVEDVCLEW